MRAERYRAICKDTQLLAQQIKGGCRIDEEDSRDVWWQSSSNYGGIAATSWSRTQDRKCCAWKCVQFERRSCGRHACRAFIATIRTHARIRSRQSRARFDGALSSQGLVPIVPPADRTWQSRLQGARQFLFRRCDLQKVLLRSKAQTLNSLMELSKQMRLTHLQLDATTRLPFRHTNSPSLRRHLFCAEKCSR